MARTGEFDTLEIDTQDRIEALKQKIEICKVNLEGGTNPRTGDPVVGAKDNLKNVLADAIYASAPDSIYSAQGLSETQKKDEIREMPIEKQIRILTEYNIDSEILSDDQNSTETTMNKYEKKLMDAQEAKEKAKADLKKEAERVIAEFNKIIETNQKIVDKLEKSIEVKEAEAKAIRDKLSGIIDPDKKKYTQPLVNRLKELEEDIKESEERLDKARATIDKCKDQVEAAIIDIENDLSLNHQIYLGENGEERESAENAAESQEIASNSYQGYENEAEGAPKSAVAALRSMEAKSDADLADCLKGKTYEDILEMTKHLGPINRASVQKRFENLLYDKYKDGNSTWQITTDDGGAVTLNFDDLMNLNKIPKDQIQEVLRNLERYSKNYSSLSPDERKTFDSKMEDLKMAMILAEARTGRAGRFLRKFGAKSRFTSLGNALSDVASKQQDREDAVYEKEDSLRKRLHVKTAMPRRNVREFNTQQKTKEQRIQSGDEWVR